MILTTSQKKALWLDSNFTNQVKYCANQIALFIVSEPNYGLDYNNPTDTIQQRIISYWQKRYQLANRIVQNPDDANIFRMLMYSVANGTANVASPLTSVDDAVVYPPLWNVDETTSLAGFIKAVWNDLAGVRSNEYPWAGENGNIQEPSDPNWYGTHFAQLPNRF